MLCTVLFNRILRQTMEKIMKLMIFTLVVLVTIPACFAYNATIGWQTLKKGPPLVVANGGTSGLYPGQTLGAYRDAANTTRSPLALYCDLQITKDNLGICRTNLFLNYSTYEESYPRGPTVHNFSGEIIDGYFSIDFTLAELLNVTGKPSADTRWPFVSETLAAPENVSQIAAEYGVETWLNVQEPEFFQLYSAPNSLTNYLISFMKANAVQYLSATTSDFLKLIKPNVTSGTELVLKHLGTEKPNVTDIATYAGGVLVNRNLVIPTRDAGYGLYTENATNFVQEAHTAGLKIFVYKFANDDLYKIFNYSDDPVLPVLSYVGDSFTVDGVVTDFPNTASTAINCYPNGFVKPSTLTAGEPNLTNPLIIAMNGASAQYPGSTMTAYKLAIDLGADYIECKVHITRDGVPICQDNVNLQSTTDISLHSDLFEAYYKDYPEGFGRGVFAFDLSFAEISVLKGIIKNPGGNIQNKAHDPSNDRKEGMLSLREFLNLSKNYTGVGLYVNVQNAYKVKNLKDLDMVSPVVTALTDANLTTPGSKVLLASEDTSALNAFKEAIPSVQRVYVIPSQNGTDCSIPQETLQEIKKYADTVSIHYRFIDRYEPDIYFLNKMTTVVQDAKDLNMTVFYSYLSNENPTLAFDYRGDSHLKIYYLLKELSLGGFITDYPATLYNFLNNNYCYHLLGGATQLNTSSLHDPMYKVYPNTTARYYDPGPFPPLNVTQDPVSYGPWGISPIPAPSPSPLPSFSPSFGSTLPLRLLASIVLLNILNFTLQLVMNTW